mmetsp:Transcript_6102/g.6844  ORF Transcript_6102/g.6844 Transcript_6102/m.6844 type:complete len:90 (-) Transcript_6102:55-324(-)
MSTLVVTFCFVSFSFKEEKIDVVDADDIDDGVLIFGLIVFDGNTKPDEVFINRRTYSRQRDFIFGLSSVVGRSDPLFQERISIQVLMEF